MINGKMPGKARPARDGVVVRKVLRAQNRYEEHIANDERQNAAFVSLLAKLRQSPMPMGMSAEQFEAALRLGFNAAWEETTGFSPL